MRRLEGIIDRQLRLAGVLRGDSVLVAVSGGPDSTALLYALAALRDTAGLSIHACTVDHGIRPSAETEADVAFVRSLCDDVGVPFHVARVGPGECAARARKMRRSLEEVARDLRLGALRDRALTIGARSVLLGHTQDDLLETILMRILQGSDVAGLRGMALRRGIFVRPLLAGTRAMVLSYLSGRGQGWREDPTNRDTVFLRNKVRLHLVPVLEREFGGWRTGLLAMSRKLALAGDVIQLQAARLPWREVSGEFIIDRAAFLGAPPAVRAASLLGLYDRFRPSGAPRRLPWRFLAPVVAGRILPERGRLMSGHGALLEARGNCLSWGPRIASGGKKGYFIEVSDAECIAIKETGMRIRLIRVAAEAENAGGIAILEGNVKPPIVLRSKRKGDEILLEGGTESVKELLAGLGVKAPDRDLIPLLADRGGVLAVLGGALGYGCRARAGALAGGGDRGARIMVRFEGGREEDSEQQ